jgi:hypothetical protein
MRQAKHAELDEETEMLTQFWWEKCEGNVAG